MKLILLVFLAFFQQFIIAIRFTTDKATGEDIIDAKLSKTPKIARDSKGNILNPQAIQPTKNEMWTNEPIKAWGLLRQNVAEEIKTLIEKSTSSNESSPPSNNQYKIIADLSAASGLHQVMGLGDRPSRNLELETRVTAAELLGEFRVLLQWQAAKSFTGELFYNTASDHRTTAEKQDPISKTVIAAYTKSAIRQIAELLNHDILSFGYDKRRIDGYGARLFRDAAKLHNLATFLGNCFQDLLAENDFDFCFTLRNLATDISKHLSQRRFQVIDGNVQDIDPLDDSYIDLDAQISDLKKRILAIQDSNSLHQTTLNP